MIYDAFRMVSYKNRCLSCFFALFARALIKLNDNLDCFHVNDDCDNLRAESGLPLVLHPVRTSLKNKAFARRQMLRMNQA